MSTNDRKNLTVAALIGVVGVIAVASAVVWGRSWTTPPAGDGGGRKTVAVETTHKPGEVVTLTANAVVFSDYLAMKKFTEYLAANDAVGMKGLSDRAKPAGGKSARIIKPVADGSKLPAYVARLTDGEQEEVYLLGPFIAEGS